MRCPLPEVKQKSTHAFPPTVAKWAHLPALWKDETCHTFYSQFVERIYSSTVWPGSQVDMNRFCVKKSSYLMRERLSDAAGALSPVYPSLHDLSNSQQVRARILRSLPRSWLQLEVVSSIRVKAVRSWLQSMPRMLVIDITSLILESTSPLIKSLPFFTLMTTVINVPTSTSQRQWRMSPHQLGIAFSS